MCEGELHAIGDRGAIVEPTAASNGPAGPCGAPIRVLSMSPQSNDPVPLPPWAPCQKSEVEIARLHDLLTKEKDRVRELKKVASQQRAADKDQIAALTRDLEVRRGPLLRFSALWSPGAAVEGARYREGDPAPALLPAGVFA